MAGRWRVVLVGVVVGVGIGLGSAAAASADIPTPIPECTPLPNGEQMTCGTTDPGVLGSNGWYLTPISFFWNPNGADIVSGCGSQSFQQDTSQLMTCTFNWNGNDITVTYTAQVELSNPTATATPARPPDSNGWYNHPVAVSFAGSSFSGIASCTPTTTYSGQTLTGSCTDNAGKTATASVSLDYDAAPPTITSATASRPPDDNGWYTHPVSFTFKGTDALSGISSCQTVRYSGPTSGWVTGGCWDRAGNYAMRTVRVSYLQVVTRPTARILSAPLLLRWAAVRHATYYNVQVYRAGRKILSLWPSAASLFLSRSWRFDRGRFRLKRGHYRWYVWPGFGSRAADSYGRMIVDRTFTVT